MIWLHFICIMVVWNENDNEKTRTGQKWKEKKNEKWNDPKESKLRIEWDPRVKD